jgi:hypothetical protein
MKCELKRESKALETAWRNKDVDLLCKYYFNFELTPEQKKIVSIVAFDGYFKEGKWKICKRTTICCATRYGKSRCISLGMLLWIASNPGGKLRLIAPTGEKTSIIREYVIESVMLCDFYMWLLDIDKKGKDRIKKAVNKKRMTWKNNADLRTLSSDKSKKGEGLMGWGGDKIIVEEAGEIPEEVWSKIQRMLLDNPDSSYVEIGNPWNRDSFFWQHWINPNWTQIHIDYKIAIKEGRFTKEQMEEVKSDPLMTKIRFQVLYEAKFPDESEDQLIPYWSIKKALRNFPLKLSVPYQEKRLGVDVAELGVDLTVFTYGRKCGGLTIVDGIKSYSKEEPEQIVGRIIELNKRINFDVIVVDSIGVGSGVYSFLKKAKRDGKISAKVVRFKGSEKPTLEKYKKEYANKKSEAYFYLREKFVKESIIIPNNTNLINQLSKIKYKFDGSGKYVILDPGQKKDDTAEKKSPDFADSLKYMVWDKKSIIFY